MKQSVKSIKYIFLFFILVFFNSCRTLKIKTEIPFSDTNIDQEIIHLGTIINKPHQPILPLIDAAIFNKRTNKIAAQIDEFEESIILDLENQFIQELTEKTGLPIIQLEDHLKQESLNFIKNKYHKSSGLFLDNNIFPRLITSKELNFFSFENGNIPKYFRRSINYGPLVKKICEDINAPKVSLLHAKLAVKGVGPFGVLGSIRLEMYLYIFSSSGRIIGKSKLLSKPKKTEGRRLDDYKNIWLEYPSLMKLLIEDLLKT